jgi:hypothetical protein
MKLTIDNEVIMSLSACARGARCRATELALQGFIHNHNLCVMVASCRVTAVNAIHHVFIMTASMLGDSSSNDAYTEARGFAKLHVCRQ